METKKESLIYVKESSKKVLSQTKRLLIFFLLLTIQIVVNQSAGVISSTSSIIKKHLNIGDKQFGLFSTFYGFGRVFGSILYTFLADRINTKYILSVDLLLKGILQIIFSLTYSKYILMALRGLIGITHMPPMIYAPLWVDQFGLSKYKTLQMTVLMAMVAYGKVSGYFLHYIFGDINWHYGFLTEGGYLILCSIIIISIDKIYFSSGIIALRKKYKAPTKNKNNAQVNNVNNTNSDEDNKEKVSIFEINESLTKRNKIAQNNNDKNTKSNNKLIRILKAPTFLICLFIRALLIGVNSSLYHWIGDYMRTAFIESNNRSVFISYLIMSLLGPVGGSISNLLVTKHLGGYENSKSGLILLLLHCLTCLSGLLMTQVNSLIFFCFSGVLFFLFSSSALPFLQGILINSVDNELKTKAFGIANVFQLSTFSVLLPFLYGYINDIYKKEYRNAALLFVISGDVVGIPFIVILYLIKKRSLNNIEETIPFNEDPNDNKDTNDKVKK